MRTCGLCKQFSIILLCSLLLVGGCIPAFNPFAGSDVINSELVQKKAPKGKEGKEKLKAQLDTTVLSIEELTSLATLLQLRYQAAMRGDVHTQRAVQLSLVALLTAATGVLLFDGSSDVLKGLALGTGAIYAASETGLNSERRKIYNAAAEAYGCIASRILGFDSVSFALDGYTDLANSIKSDFLTLKKPYMTATSDVKALRSELKTDLSNKSSEQQNQTKLEELKKAGASPEEIEKYLQDIKETNNKITEATALLNTMETAYSYYTKERNAVGLAIAPVAKLNESFFQEIISMESKITYELARLEPDFTAFANSVKGTLAAGYAMGTPSRTNVGISEEDKNAANSFTASNINKSNTLLPDNILESVNKFKNMCCELNLAIQEFKDYGDLTTQLVEAGLSINQNNESCWKYVAQTFKLAAKPAEPTFEGEQNATTTIIIEGVKGALNAESTHDGLTATPKPLTGSTALLILTWKDPNVGTDTTVPVVVYDVSGDSITVEVKLTKPQ